MRMNLEILCRNIDQAAVIAWCFENLKPFTWGIMSIADATIIYFDVPTDVEKIVDRWA